MMDVLIRSLSLECLSMAILVGGEMFCVLS